MGQGIQDNRLPHSAGPGPTHAGGQEQVPHRSSIAARSLRSFFRSALLAFSLTEVLLRFALLRVRRGGRLSLTMRAQWLHRACRMIARRLSMRVTAEGPLPSSGLVVSNHLSYLDILFYSSLLPCIFVSKSEVLSWPMFGILARCGGTIFVDRARGTGVNSAAQQINSALDAGIPVILFPEGTSTDGSTVLKFFPALFESAVQAGAPVIASAVAYELGDGLESDLCYYGDITFAPHLLKALAHEDVHARIMFASRGVLYADRKTAARETREQILAKRALLAPGRA